MDQQLSIRLVVCRIRGRGFDAHRHKPSVWNDQQRWLSLVNIDGGRMRVFHREGSTMLSY